MRKNKNCQKKIKIVKKRLKILEEIFTVKLVKNQRNIWDRKQNKKVLAKKATF